MINFKWNADKIVQIMAVLFVAALIAVSYGGVKFKDKNSVTVDKLSDQDLAAQVMPERGVELPIVWGDFGKRMTESGVIDAAKLEDIYKGRGGLSTEDKTLLNEKTTGHLRMTRENSGFILNLLWGFGLGNKSPVLENGPMMDKQYNGAGNFASTGGWTLAKGGAMEHYSKHQFLKLTAEQESLVERVAKNIYRPCCGNSAYFPDCNHGMAMLGLLEIMSAQGVSEAEMYKAALAVNSYWFPDTYVTIAKYFAKRGVAWANVDPKTILGSAYSSGQGYQQILKEVAPPENAGGGGCGI